MRQDVIARQIGAMRDAKLDALISVSPENFAYVTGFLSPTQPLMRWRHAMALVTADGESALIVVDMEANTIRAKAPAAVLSCVVPVSTPAQAQSGQLAGIYYKDDLIAEPMRLVDGAIELPTASGMGIAVDQDKITRYRVGGASKG